MDTLICKNVNFNGDDLLAVKNNETNLIYVGISYICKGIGFNKGQKDRQTENVQKDLVLRQGCRKFGAGVLNENNEAIGMDINYLPLWLAKISITPKMQNEQPEVVEKLVQYQLKAKDVLAEAFVKKMLTPQQELKLHYQVLENHEEDIKEVKLDIKDIKENSPLYNIECDELQKLVKKIGTRELGGHGTKAYKDKPLRTKVYSDIQHELKREFGVSSYKAIKRCQLSAAKEIVNSYKAPMVLKDQILLLNNQMSI